MKEHRRARTEILTILALATALLLLNTSASAFNAALSDQGTDVTDKATGEPIELGNITISIWDALTGGNQIYTHTFTNAIRNGTWSVMLGEQTPLNLYYGNKYYKDYSINGEDIDFRNATGATVERQFFYSPIGTIGGEDINESTLDCIAITGSASLCDGIDNDSPFDPTDYARKNESETWGANNITASYFLGNVLWANVIGEPTFLTTYTETDPIFTAHDASAVTSAKITNWDTAYSWGNHSAEGYLTSYTETDPIFGAHDASAVTSAKITNWDNASSWGDHANQGYLTSASSYYNETEIDNKLTNASEWNTAYAYGNHSAAGYLTSESDPIFDASPAKSITSTNTNNWSWASNYVVSHKDMWSTAYSWGNHASASYLTSYTETDPVYSGDPASGITNTNINNWNTAYAYGNHSAAGYLTTYTETDPIFNASPAKDITNPNITNWDTAYTWGNHASAGYSTTDSTGGWTNTSTKTSTTLDVNTSGTVYADAFSSNSPLKLQTGDTTRIYVNDTTGNVGIGTTTPTSTLTVDGDINATGHINTQGNLTGKFIYGYANMNDASDYSTTEKMFGQNAYENTYLNGLTWYNSGDNNWFVISTSGVYEVRLDASVSIDQASDGGLVVLTIWADSIRKNLIGIKVPISFSYDDTSTSASTTWVGQVNAGQKIYAKVKGFSGADCNSILNCGDCTGNGADFAYSGSYDCTPAAISTVINPGSSFTVRKIG
ncbi:hypothetical protein ACFL3V_06080 [Nanoarchaeota archaeon]